MNRPERVLEARRARIYRRIALEARALLTRRATSPEPIASERELLEATARACASQRIVGAEPALVMSACRGEWLFSVHDAHAHDPVLWMTLHRLAASAPRRVPLLLLVYRCEACDEASVFPLEHYTATTPECRQWLHDVLETAGLHLVEPPPP